MKIRGYNGEIKSEAIYYLLLNYVLDGSFLNTFILISMSPIDASFSLRSLSLTSPLDNLYPLIKTYYAPKAPPRDINKK